MFDAALAGRKQHDGVAVWICTLSEEEEKWNGVPLCSKACRQGIDLVFILLLPLILFIALVFFFFFFFYSCSWSAGCRCIVYGDIGPSYLIASLDFPRAQDYQPDRWLDAEQALGPSRTLRDEIGPLDPSA